MAQSIKKIIIPTVCIATPIVILSGVGQGVHLFGQAAYQLTQMKAEGYILVLVAKSLLDGVSAVTVGLNIAILMPFIIVFKYTSEKNQETQTETINEMTKAVFFTLFLTMPILTALHFIVGLGAAFFSSSIKETYLANFIGLKDMLKPMISSLIFAALIGSVSFIQIKASKTTMKRAMFCALSIVAGFVFVFVADALINVATYLLLELPNN